MKRILPLLLVLLFSLRLLAGEARYVFYFIGDGMGPNEVLAAEMYLAELNGEIGRKQLCMSQLPYSGQASTYSASNSITDSSAAGTCLATGVKTTNGVLGQTPKGEHLTTIAEMLKQRGWAIGITTSVSIDHATPASFYAHVSRRGDYYTIGRQMIESDFDFFGGATFYKPLDENDPTQPSLYDLLEENHYIVARGYNDYVERSIGAKKMVLIQEGEGLSRDYKGSGMIPYAIDKKESDLTLPQITSAAINFLSRNERFFLMVEGGAIDWACHGNDGATVIHDVIEFDESIRLALEFYKEHPEETLIVITADHETGGLALGNSDYTLNLQVLQHQHASVARLNDILKAKHQQLGKQLSWEQVQDILKEYVGLYSAVEVTAEEDMQLKKAFKKSMKNSDKVKTLYKELSRLADTAVRILNRKSKLGWTTGSHSAAAVPVFAIGAGAEQFTGWMDNTQIMPRMLEACNQ